MKPAATLRIPAKLDNLGAIRDFVQARVLALRGRDIVCDVLQAVDEWAANIILHGYERRPGEIEIDIRRQERGAGKPALVIRIRDWAPVFDPTRVPEPDLSVPLDQRAPGGLGIYLIRQFMDSMEHRAMPEGGNELVLTRRLQRGGNDGDQRQ